MTTRLIGQPPTIVCLCGSTRFRAEYDLANRRETLAGRIVLSVGFFTHAEAWDFRLLCGPEGPTLEQRRKAEGNKELQLGESVAAALDYLHLWKIELAHEILVITDRTKFVGRSTRNEILYAEATSKRVRWLVDEVSPEQLRAVGSP